MYDAEGQAHRALKGIGKNIQLCILISTLHIPIQFLQSVGNIHSIVNIYTDKDIKTVTVLSKPEGLQKQETHIF